MKQFKKFIVLFFVIVCGCVCFALAACNNETKPNNDGVKYVEFSSMPFGANIDMYEPKTERISVPYKKWGYWLFAQAYDYDGYPTGEKLSGDDYYFSVPGVYTMTFSSFDKGSGEKHDYTLVITIENPTQLTADIGQNEGYVYAKDTSQLFYFTPEESGDYTISTDKGHTLSVAADNGMSVALSGNTVELEKEVRYGITVTAGERTGEYGLSIAFTPRKLAAENNTVTLAAGGRRAYDLTVDESGYYLLDYSGVEIQTKNARIERSQNSCYVYLNATKPNVVIFVNGKESEQQIDLTISALEAVDIAQGNSVLSFNEPIICIRNPYEEDLMINAEFAYGEGKLDKVANIENSDMRYLTTCITNKKTIHPIWLPAGQKYYMITSGMDAQPDVDIIASKTNLRWRVNGEIISGNILCVERGPSYKAELVELIGGEAKLVDVKSYYNIPQRIVEYDFVNQCFNVCDDARTGDSVRYEPTGYEDFSLVLKVVD